MNAHTQKQLENFLSELLETNATPAFYCDFEKIRKNVANIEISLNMLNFLLGKQDLRTAVESLWKRDRKVFDVLLILIAVRKRDNKKVVTPDGGIVPLEDYLTSVDGVVEFLEKTGLAQLFRDKIIKNIVDYVFGVEAGLDSHARKNRSGHAMEGLIAGIFDQNGIHYRQEVYSTEFPEVHRVLGGDKKRFDFVIPTKSSTFLIEVNFYSDGGSKPNEVARAYTELSPKVNSVKGYQFVWITDGMGWLKAKSMITAAYISIPHVYNLKNIKDFIRCIIEEGQEK